MPNIPKEALELHKKGLRRCGHCHKVKPVDLFYRDSSNKTFGRTERCKECMKALRRGYRRDPEKVRAQYKQWRAKQDDADLSRRRWASKLRIRYGLTVEQHGSMYTEQNGCCLLCGQSVPYDRIQTDHDHTTGRVRGLLCIPCNIWVGFLEKNLGRLDKTMDYINGEEKA